MGGGNFENMQIGVSPRKRMFVYKGEGVKISESSAYVLCRWPSRVTKMAVQALFLMGENSAILCLSY